MKQSRVGLGVVTMLSVFVIVCMSVLMFYTYRSITQTHEQVQRSYSFKKAYYKAEILAYEKITSGENDFKVHILEDSYLCVLVEDGQIVKFKVSVVGD